MYRRQLASLWGNENIVEWNSETCLECTTTDFLATEITEWVEVVHESIKLIDHAHLVLLRKSPPGVEAPRWMAFIPPSVLSYSVNESLALLVELVAKRVLGTVHELWDRMLGDDAVFAAKDRDSGQIIPVEFVAEGRKSDVRMGIVA